MKTNIILVLVLSLALLSFMGTTIAAKTPKLSEDVQLKVLELQASGKFAEADTLHNQELAKLELAVKKASAQKELDAKKAEAQKKLRVEWAKQIQPMPIDTVWTWCDSQEKAFFLGQRYGVSDVVDSSTTLDKMVEAMKIEIKYHEEFRSDLNKEIAPYQQKVMQQNQLVTNLAADLAELQMNYFGVTDEITEVRGQLDSLKCEITNLWHAVNENGYSIDAALSVLKTVKTNDHHPNTATQKRLEKAQREAAAKGEALQ
jgi:hypothetical protein